MIFICAALSNDLNCYQLKHHRSADKCYKGVIFVQRLITHA